MLSKVFKNERARTDLDKGSLTQTKALSDAGFSTHQQRTISRAEELLKQFDGRGNHWREKNKTLGTQSSNLTQKEVTEQSRHKKPACKPIGLGGLVNGLFYLY